MKNGLTTVVKTRLATLWDKTEIPVTEKFYLAWSSADIPENTVLRLDDKFSCKKSAVAKIEMLREDHYCPPGQRMSADRRQYYEELAKPKDLSQEDIDKRKKTIEEIRVRNPHLFSESKKQGYQGEQASENGPQNES